MATEIQEGRNDVPILDIRQADVSASAADGILEGLRPAEGHEKRLPTMLLSSEQKSKLFEQCRQADAELDVFDRLAATIAQSISTGFQIIDLGSGNLRTTRILLQALEDAEKDVDYYIVDLSFSELQRSLLAVRQDGYKHITSQGLRGTHEDGLHWMKQLKNAVKSKLVVLNNFPFSSYSRSEAVIFLKRFFNVLGDDGAMLIRLDARKDKTKGYCSYNDCEGEVREFYLNRLTYANFLLGQNIFKDGDWTVLDEYDENARRHQAFYIPLVDMTIAGCQFNKGEKVKAEETYAYSKIESDELWHVAGFTTRATFRNPTSNYNLHLLNLPSFSFPLDVESYARQRVPSLQEYQQLWGAWDTVTRRMIPEKELLSKPIKLRHCFLFYLGHIPTFLDIHLTKAIQVPPTYPAYFRSIFERGIDPDVDNPEKCHAHSEVPDTWPTLDEILAFQNRVRQRVRFFYESRSVEENKELGRSLWLGFEHEALHLETLLYMLIQSDTVSPPPGNIPDFAASSEEARKNRVSNDWITVPAETISIGFGESGDDLSNNAHFGWDNEKPRRLVDVPAFQAQARPVTNEEFARYLDQTNQSSLPALWKAGNEGADDHAASSGIERRLNGAHAQSNGTINQPLNAYLDGKFVRTFYGPVPLKYALDWPVMASYDQLAAYAAWMGGRIPTLEELQSIYNYVDRTKSKEAEQVQTRTISAVNGHLSNNGVEESPPSHRFPNGTSNTEPSPDPHRIFVDLNDCNVGFKTYHPEPVTQNGHRLSGRCELGGVWEWTSTVLEKHVGFQAMDSYPGYTADFFDGKHNIVLGGSWATHPRIAGRKTFINWYQRNYPYAWVGARLVRDI